MIDRELVIAPSKSSVLSFSSSFENCSCTKSSVSWYSFFTCTMESTRLAVLHFLPLIRIWYPSNARYLFNFSSMEASYR